MSNAKLKTRIKNFVKNELSDYGFYLEAPRIPVRELKGFKQGIEFQPGTSSLSGKYTLNIFRRYTLVTEEDESFDSSIRIGKLMGEDNLWFSREDDIDEVFKEVKQLIREHVLPYFQKYDTIEKILLGFENKEFSQTEGFGESICWQHFNLARCYNVINNKEKAIKHYKIVLEEYSESPIEYVQKRKELVKQELEKLNYT